MKYVDRIFRTDGHRTTVLIRLMVGHVFITQVNQKYIFSEAFGVGPLTRIGLLFHELMALLKTKLSVIKQKSLLTFSYEGRTDLLMLFGPLFFLLKGAGEYSADKRSMQVIKKIS